MYERVQRSFLQHVNYQKQQTKTQKDAKSMRFFIVKLEQTRHDILKQTITCSNSTMETLEKVVKYV